MKSKIIIILGLILFSCSSKNKENNGETSTILSDTISNKNNAKFNKEVFGFHPYWAKKKHDNYNYNVLTNLAYYSYVLNPTTGSYKNISEWKNSTIIDIALDSSVNVYLTLTNLTKHKNEIFLRNLQAQKISIDSVSSLINTRKAHGVIIDFENVPNSLTENYTNYIRTLFHRLQDEGKKIAITLPNYHTDIFNIENLNQYVDFFIIKSYNYFYKIGEPAGPTAPFKEVKSLNNNSLTQTIEDYLNANIPKEKFILTFPYYGIKWETEEDSLHSIALSLNHLHYNQIKNDLGDKEIKYDSITESAYYKYTDEDGSHFQVWFDDDKTLSKKYDLIFENDLGGIAIWALSFDGGYNELWNLLNNKFTK